MTASTSNAYGPENWDSDRFGPYQSTPHEDVGPELDRLLSPIETLLDGLASVYELLGDEASKSLLVQVLAYRLMGPHKVKLPLNTAEYWSWRAGLRSLIRGSDTIDLNFLGMKLNRMALGAIGYPIEMYFLPLGVMNTFVLKQYAYTKRQPPIAAREGDCVIDAGGCYGDTALYFAHEVGPRGRVFSFEFAPDNLRIHEQNMNLNPELGRRIEVVSNALWDVSGKALYFRAFGPATQVTAGQEHPFEDSLLVATVSIDDFVREQSLPRVDFIKMDIEGAELRALRGADETIHAFKPGLAISIYHSANDFLDIPSHLHGLGLGYEFFLDHFTVYGEETVLFAAVRDRRLPN